MRIAFCTAEQQEAVRGNAMTRQLSRQILLQSVTLRRKEITDEDLEEAGLVAVKSGALKGCYVTGDPNEAVVHHQRLINDPILGVMWKE